MRTGEPACGSSSALPSTCSITPWLPVPTSCWRVRLWDDAELPESAAFWYIVYHTLFWLDLYLSGAVEGFAPPAPFTLDELDPAGLLPERPYTRDELQAYLEHGREEVPGDDRRADRRAGFSPLQVSVGRGQLRRAAAGQHAPRPGARRAVEPDPGAEGRLVAQVGRAGEDLRQLSAGGAGQMAARRRKDRACHIGRGRMPSLK